MPDDAVAAQIERLVAEEHALQRSEQQDRSDPSRLDGDLERLRSVRIELDRCWDLLRQRRALREAGAKPGGAQVRSAEVVENYRSDEWPGALHRRAIRITDDKERSRLAAEVDGELAGWLDYRPAGPSVIVAHTEVVGEHAGQGLGAGLVRTALARARGCGKTVIVTCPFAASYIDRHTELSEYLAPVARRSSR